MVATLVQRILGRTALGDIVHPLSGEVLVEGGRTIEEADIDKVEKAGIQSVQIRSALTARCAPASARSSTGAISPAARPSTWARPSASSRRSRSASPALSSPCARSTWRHGAGGGPVVPGGSYEGHGPDPQPQRGARFGRAPRRHGPQHGRPDPRSGGQGAGLAPASPTAAASSSTTGTRCVAASASPSGTPTPARC